MRINRRELKSGARVSLRQANPDALFMTLIFLLLTSGLSLVAGMLSADPVSRILYLHEQGLPLERTLPLVLSGVGSVGVFVNILLAVFGLVVDFGYSFWCLNTSRGIRGDLGDLTEGFALVGRILWLRILVLVYQFLWYLAIFMPTLFVVIPAVFVPVIGPFLAAGVTLLAGLVFATRILRYELATLCLIDEPDLGSSNALRRSRQIMGGHVKDYVLLLLSFIGWYLLALVLAAFVEGAVAVVMSGFRLITDMETMARISGSMPVAVIRQLASWPLQLWLIPYVTLTKCKFYDKIRAEGQSDPTVENN